MFLKLRPVWLDYTPAKNKKRKTFWWDERKHLDWMKKTIQDNENNGQVIKAGSSDMNPKKKKKTIPSKVWTLPSKIQPRITHPWDVEEVWASKEAEVVIAFSPAKISIDFDRISLASKDDEGSNIDPWWLKIEESSTTIDHDAAILLESRTVAPKQTGKKPRAVGRSVNSICHSRLLVRPSRPPPHLFWYNPFTSWSVMIK